MKVTVRLRKGDWVIIAGAATIAAYEKWVRDDEDLISRRVAAYKAAHPVLTHAAIWLTAAHLAETLPEKLDPYHRAVKWFRRNVGERE